MMRTNPPPSWRAPSARLGDDDGSLRGSAGHARPVGSEAWKPRLGVGFLFDRWWWACSVVVPRWALALLIVSWASLVVTWVRMFWSLSHG
jgi:hypothetical protein